MTLYSWEMLNSSRWPHLLVTLLLAGSWTIAPQGTQAHELTPESQQQYAIVYVNEPSLPETWAQMVQQLGEAAATETLQAAAKALVAGETVLIPGLTEDLASQLNTTDDTAELFVENHLTAAAIPNFPVSGQIVAGTDRRTWRMNVQVVRTACVFIMCEITDRRITGITFDPGGTGSRLQFQQSYFPSTGAIEVPSYTIRVYRNSSLNGSITLGVGVGFRSTTVSHSVNLRSNGFTFTVTGSALVNGSLVNLSSVRTNSGGCSSATSPICRFDQ